jgi:hypothetical protein
VAALLAVPASLVAEAFWPGRVVGVTDGEPACRRRSGN